MGEIRGELAESVEFFGLLLNARDFADAIKQHRDAALGHGRNRGEHLGEESVGDIERPDGADGEAFAAVVLHAREGKLAGHGAGAADEEGDVACAPAPYLDLAAEDEVHVVGRVVFAEEDGTVWADTLVAVGCEPGVFLFTQAVERADGAESGDNLGDRRGLCGWAGDYWLICLDERLRGKQAFVAVQVAISGAPSRLVRASSLLSYVSIVTGVPHLHLVRLE